MIKIGIRYCCENDIYISISLNKHQEDRVTLYLQQGTCFLSHLELQPLLVLTNLTSQRYVVRSKPVGLKHFQNPPSLYCLLDLTCKIFLVSLSNIYFKKIQASKRYNDASLKQILKKTKANSAKAKKQCKLLVKSLTW